jgi:hypothetical protein
MSHDIAEPESANAKAPSVELEANADTGTCNSKSTDTPAVGQDDARVVTLFRGRGDPKVPGAHEVIGQRHALTFRELRDTITTAPEGGKYDLAIMLAESTDGSAKGDKSVSGSCLGYDFDGADPTTFTAMARTLPARIGYLSYSELSGEKPARRARIILATSRKLTRDEHPTVWKRVARAWGFYGLKVDETKGTTYSLFYVTHPPGKREAFQQSVTEFSDLNGPVIDVDNVLAWNDGQDDEPDTPAARTSAPAQTSVERRAMQIQQVRAAVEYVKPSFVAGQRHTVARDLSFAMRHHCVAEDIARAGIETLCGEGRSQRPSGHLATLEGIYRKDPQDCGTMSAGVVGAAVAGLVNDTLVSLDIRQLAAPRTALAPAEHAPEPNPWGTPITSAAELFAPQAPVNWLVKPLDLACGGAVNLLAGYGYSGKTTALQAMALSVVTGRPVWGAWACKRGRALQVDREQGRRVTEGKYARLAREMGVKLQDLDGRLGRLYMPPTNFKDQGTAEHLIRLCSGYDLVFFDSLRAFSAGYEENSSEIREPLDMLSHVSEKTGACIIAVHHANKPTKENGGGNRYAMRGSGAIYDAAAAVLIFSGEPGQPIKVSPEKARTSGRLEKPFTLEFADTLPVANPPEDTEPFGGLRVSVRGAKAPSDPVADLEIDVLRVIKAQAGGVVASRAEIGTHIRKRRSDLKGVIDGLKRKGEIWENNDGIGLNREGVARLLFPSTAGTASLGGAS